MTRVMVPLHVSQRIPNYSSLSYFKPDVKAFTKLFGNKSNLPRNYDPSYSLFRVSFSKFQLICTYIHLSVVLLIGLSPGSTGPAVGPSHWLSML